VREKRGIDLLRVFLRERFDLNGKTAVPLSMEAAVAVII
jgi:hypothetical protein